MPKRLLSVLLLVLAPACVASQGELEPGSSVTFSLAQPMAQQRVPRQLQAVVARSLGDQERYQWKVLDADVEKAHGSIALDRLGGLLISAEGDGADGPDSLQVREGTLVATRHSSSGEWSRAVGLPEGLDRQSIELLLTERLPAELWTEDSVAESMRLALETMRQLGGRVEALRVPSATLLSGARVLAGVAPAGIAAADTPPEDCSKAEKIIPGRAYIGKFENVGLGPAVGNLYGVLVEGTSLCPKGGMPSTIAVGWAAMKVGKPNGNDNPADCKTGYFATIQVKGAGRFSNVGTGCTKDGADASAIDGGIDRGAVGLAVGNAIGIISTEGAISQTKADIGCQEQLCAWATGWASICVVPSPFSMVITQSQGGGTSNESAICDKAIKAYTPVLP